ncbi:hypothetical protein [Nonomuraea sp. KM90]|uniref:hypothetical protein n=1 Tax=Nonomuraea sp. KM90 TaxID=3457428 RepID=UPI003FCCF872
MPASIETRQLSLFILTIMIVLTVAAIRGLLRRTHIVMVIGGTSVMLMILAILAAAYLITFAGA